MQQKYSFISVEDATDTSANQVEKAAPSGGYEAQKTASQTETPLASDAEVSSQKACVQEAPTTDAPAQDQPNQLIQGASPLEHSSQHPDQSEKDKGQADKALERDYLELKEDLESVPPMPKIQKIVLLCLVCFVFGFAVYQFIIHSLLNG